MLFIIIRCKSLALSPYEQSSDADFLGSYPMNHKNKIMLEFIQQSDNIAPCILFELIMHIITNLF